MKNCHIKQKLYSLCLKHINKRLEVIQTNILEIQKSLASETKNSAGDKHETGRAMLQLEREKVGAQLLEAEKIKQTLSKINIKKNIQTIGIGSVVFTTQNNYFIAISAGELMAEDNRFYAVSSISPIGKSLIGKTTGDVVNFRNSIFKIVEVW